MSGFFFVDSLGNVTVKCERINRGRMEGKEKVKTRGKIET